MFSSCGKSDAPTEAWIEPSTCDQIRRHSIKGSYKSLTVPRDSVTQSIDAGTGGGGGGRVSFASDLQQISPLSEMDHESGFRESESPPSPSPILDEAFMNSIVNETSQQIKNMNNYHPSHRHLFHGSLHQSSYLLNPSNNQSPSPSGGLLIHYLNQTSDQFLPADNCSKDMISASSSTSSNIGSSSCTGSSVNGGVGSGQQLPPTIIFPSVHPGLPFVSENSPILTSPPTNQPGNNGMGTLYFNDYSTLTVSNVRKILFS